MLRLLCVTAHPDDEASSFGGTLLLCHERGIQTKIICLTEGRAATHRGGAASGEELGAIRRREFAAACKVLNTEGEVLNYADSALEREDFYAVVGDLTRRIREYRPQVVATYGPDGSVTAHTDHGMASLFTSAAYQAAARPKRYPEQLSDGLQPWQPQKLYYSTTNFFMEGRPPVSLAPSTCAVEIGPARLELKIEAFKQHATQAPLFGLFESHVRPRGTKELFHLAAAITPRRITIEEDLFEGVKKQ
ncbi:MAG TPA: PIG-L family deacetylase [Candidatus Acidoferrales bacterium]|nr:PIG-L family deacetylase [Candidatus Acidoferrales bacterium]